LAFRRARFILILVGVALAAMCAALLFGVFSPSGERITGRKASRIFVKEGEASFALPELVSQLELPALLELGCVEHSVRTNDGGRDDYYAMMPTIELEEGSLRDVLEKLVEPGLVYKMNGVEPTGKTRKLRWEILGGEVLHIYDPEYFDDQRNPLNLKCRTDFTLPGGERAPGVSSAASSAHGAILKLLKREIEEQCPQAARVREERPDGAVIERSRVRVFPVGGSTGTPEHYLARNNISVPSCSLQSQGHTLRDVMLMALVNGHKKQSENGGPRHHLWVVYETSSGAIGSRTVQDEAWTVKIALTNWNANRSRSLLATAEICERMSRTGVQYGGEDLGYASSWSMVDDLSAELVRRAHFDAAEVAECLSRNKVLEKAEHVVLLATALARTGEAEVLEHLFDIAGAIADGRRHRVIVMALFQSNDSYEGRFDARWKELADAEKDPGLKRMMTGLLR